MAGHIPHPIDPAIERRLDRLRQWAGVLDNAFRVPGTGIRFGWDPILGLVPGIGDLVAPAYAIAIIVTAAQLGVPRIVQVRMLLTATVDLVIGALPVVGDLFDFAWRANDRNMALLERYVRNRRPAGRGDWLFVIAVLAVLVIAAALPLIALAALIQWMVQDAA
ncbi:MAG TPA: DUF4112 domain-containing protein [Vicinamibacterales bacterium]|nr:DUF4112 domain-containing protein [Vicinamibacterales bacterium]